MKAEGYPLWMYHADHGARKFDTPEALEKAGKGWHDSPDAVGLTPSVPQGVNAAMQFDRSPVQPMDESVANADEIAALAKKPKRAIEPTTVASRRRATKTKK